MRTKSPLVMLEQVVMLLVFALAAALCLRAFVQADSMSKTNAARDEAMVQVQQAAEVVKHCRGDLEQAADILEGHWDGETLTIPAADFTVTAVPVPTDDDLPGMAEISAADPKGTLLFRVSVAWQREDG